MASDRHDQAEDAAVSRAWTTTQSAQPPASLDDAVLKFARDAQTPLRARRRWQAPLALAAVLTLGLGVVLQLWREPQVRAPQPAAAEPPAAAAAAPTPSPSSMPAAVDEMRDAQPAAVEVQKRAASAKRSESSASRQREASAAAAAAADAESQRRVEQQRKAIDAPPPPPPAFAEQDAPPAPAAAAVAEAPPVAMQRIAAAATAPRAFMPAPAVAPPTLPLAKDWLAGHGWSEAPQIEPHDWTCGQQPSGATAAGQTIWFYPTRGAWLVLDEQQRVLQVHHAADCE